MQWLTNIGILKNRIAFSLAFLILISAAAVGSLMLSSTPSEATTPNEVFVSPDGARIEVFTNQVSAEAVYGVLKANADALDAIRPNLTVKVGDDLRTGEFQNWDVGVAASGLQIDPNVSCMPIPVQEFL